MSAIPSPHTAAPDIGKLLEAARGALSASSSGDRFSDAEVHRIYRVAGTILFNGKLQEAKALLAAACGLRPGRASYWQALGYVQRELGAIDGAVMSYRTALLLEPDNVDHLVDLADCHLRAGERQLALGMLKPALEAYCESGAQGRMPDRAMALAQLLVVH